jgi:hypothetical protein
VEHQREKTSQKCGETSDVLETKRVVTRPNSVRKSFLKGLGEIWKGDRQKRITFVFPTTRDALSIPKRFG